MFEAAFHVDWNSKKKVQALDVNYCFQIRTHTLQRAEGPVTCQSNAVTGSVPAVRELTMAAPNMSISRHSPWEAVCQWVKGGVERRAAEGGEQAREGGREGGRAKTEVQVTDVCSRFLLVCLLGFSPHRAFGSRSGEAHWLSCTSASWRCLSLLLACELGSKAQ